MQRAPRAQRGALASGGAVGVDGLGERLIEEDGYLGVLAVVGLQHDPAEPGIELGFDAVADHLAGHLHRLVVQVGIGLLKRLDGRVVDEGAVGLLLGAHEVVLVHAHAEHQVGNNLRRLGLGRLGAFRRLAFLGGSGPVCGECRLRTFIVGGLALGRPVGGLFGAGRRPGGRTSLDLGRRLLGGRGVDHAGVVGRHGGVVQVVSPGALDARRCRHAGKNAHPRSADAPRRADEGDSKGDPAAAARYATSSGPHFRSLPLERGTSDAPISTMSANSVMNSKRPAHICRM